jgi:hypothetical protein
LWKCKGEKDNARQKLLQTIIAIKKCRNNFKAKDAVTPYQQWQIEEMQKKKVSKTTHNKEPTHIKQKELNQHKKE